MRVSKYVFMRLNWFTSFFPSRIQHSLKTVSSKPTAARVLILTYIRFASSVDGRDSYIEALCKMYEKQGEKGRHAEKLESRKEIGSDEVFCDS